MKKEATFRGCLEAILSGIGYGAIPLIILFFSRDSQIESSVYNMMRMLIAGLILLPSAISHSSEIKEPVSFFFKMLLCSFFMSATTILLYASYDFIPSGIGVMLHYSYPLIVLILEVLIFHGKASRTTIIVTALTLAGIVLLCDVSSLSGQFTKGIVLALLSAVTFSIYLSAIEHQKVTVYHISLYTSVLGLLNACFLCIYNILKGYFRLSFPPRTYIIFLVIGIIANLAITLQALAIRDVGSVITSILGTLEPIVCTLGSALILHDRITLRMVFGSILILIAVVKASVSPKTSK